MGYFSNFLGLGYFGHFGGFKDVLVILEVSGVFWSSWRFQGIWSLFRFQDILVIFRGFEGILVIFEVLRVFWSF